jgi:hypothetical protein
MMRINPQDKMINKRAPNEKWVVRKAFEDMLPRKCSLETKEQFSDGVDMVGLIKKEVVAVEVTDEQLASAKFRFRCRRYSKKNITTVLYSMNIFQVTLRSFIKALKSAHAVQKSH